MPVAKSKKTGPTPIFILLTAIRDAVDAGVDRAKISTMLEQSIEAATTRPDDDGPKQQSPIFKNSARTLDRYTAAVQREEDVPAPG